MTVRALPPLIRYTGNGVITKYDWDWDMVEDSSINVLVDNYNVLNWSLQDQSVVFDTPPEDGAEIIIYRRTKIWQPDDYQAFGRFHSEKTELTMDRQTLIAQERQGDSTNPGEPNGIVGGSNLSTTRGEYTVTVVSERGTDAVVPMYIPDDATLPPPATPDSTIIWGGVEIGNVVNGTDNVIDGTRNIVSGTVSSGLGEPISGGVYGDESQNAIIRFLMSFAGGDDNQASAAYSNFNANAYVGWCSVDPSDNEYWMRVNETSGLISSRYTINDSFAHQPENTPFKIRGYPAGGVYGPYMTVHTYGDAAPSTRTGTFLIEICKDNGNGLPDGEWIGRNVTLSSILNDSTPPPVDTTGSVSWTSFFGQPFALETKLWDELKIIPTAGVSIAFTIPNTARPFTMTFVTVENTSVSSTRTGSVGQTVGDYTSDPTYTWGTGGGIAAGINFTGTDIDLIPGQTYFFCVRNDTPATRNNYIRVRIFIQEQ